MIDFGTVVGYILKCERCLGTRLKASVGLFEITMSLTEKKFIKIHKSDELCYISCITMKIINHVIIFLISVVPDLK